MLLLRDYNYSKPLKLHPNKLILEGKIDVDYSGIYLPLTSFILVKSLY